MTRAPRLAVAVLAVLAVLASLGTAAPGRADDGATGDKAPAADGTATEALAALARVESIFSPTTARRAPAGGDTDATLALRDLSLLVDDLPADRRAEARAYFRRPTDSGGDGALNYGNATVQRVCGGIICVHYATSGVHAPSDPNWASTALATLRHVQNTYTAAGYKRPRGDGAIGGGGTNRVDVYLGDIDREGSGLYGYCTTDEVRDGPPYSRWAYCVLDDDYANIPTNTAVENLRVTAAHEYFHAVQYAYDYLEDGWFLEATAAWVEDEMYDGVNDNRQYLANSPLRSPRRSMDQFEGLWHYGVWIFFRYLTERFTAQQGGLPTLVRDMWRRADGTTTAARDQYSWQAVNSVLKARGSSAAAQFAAFSVGNRRPNATYDEGAALNYPAAPLWAQARLTGSRRSATGAIRLNHLTSATARFTPSGLSATTWKLRLRFDMAPTGRGSRAIVVVTGTNGRVKSIPVRLNGSGDGSRAVAFSTRSVRHVEVTLVNAGARFRCFEGTRFSCQGTPLDDRLTQRVTATAFR